MKFKNTPWTFSVASVSFLLDLSAVYHSQPVSRNVINNNNNIFWFLQKQKASPVILLHPPYLHAF